MKKITFFIGFIFGMVSIGCCQDHLLPLKKVETSSTMEDTKVVKAKEEYTCGGESGALSDSGSDLILETEIESIKYEEMNSGSKVNLMLKDCYNKIKTRVLTVKKGRWNHEFYFFTVRSRNKLGSDFKVGSKKELRAVIDLSNNCYVVKDREIVPDPQNQYEPDCSY